MTIQTYRTYSDGKTWRYVVDKWVTESSRYLGRNIWMISYIVVKDKNGHREPKPYYKSLRPVKSCRESTFERWAKFEVKEE